MKLIYDLVDEILEAVNSMAYSRATIYRILDVTHRSWVEEITCHEHVDCPNFANKANSMLWHCEEIEKERQQLRSMTLIAEQYSQRITELVR
jgi:hypothetical protein